MAILIAAALLLQDLHESPGAWEPLMSRMEAAPEPARARLGKAARIWSNTVQGVWTDVEAAAPLVARLDKLRQQPFDSKAFIDAVVQAWCRADGLGLLSITVTRHGHGRGISIEVWLCEEAACTDAPTLLSYGSPRRGTLGGIKATPPILQEELETDLAELKEAMDQGADRPLRLLWLLQRIDQSPRRP